MITTLCFLVYFYTLFQLDVVAVKVPRQGRAGCVILLDKLYCYGGAFQYKATSAANNAHVYLDLTTPNLDIYSAQNSWQEVPNPSGFKLEPNFYFASTPVSNTSYMVISGVGYNDISKTKLTNETTIFHADTNLWESIPMSPFPQSKGPTAILDQNGTVWLWGGNPVTEDYTMTSSIYSFEVEEKTWKSHSLDLPVRTELGVRFSAATAFSDQDDTIYYFGGLRNATPGKKKSRPYDYIPLISVLAFNTRKVAWSLISAVNEGPSTRIDHSATFLPKKNQVVIYGGVYADTKEHYNKKQDYCWLFDINSATWKDITFKLSSEEYGAGIRFGHDATLYLERYLIIAFGFNSSNSAQNDISILDTDTWSWQKEMPSKPNETQGIATPIPTQSSLALRTDAIVGITLGGTVFLAACAVAAVICLRRKKNNSFAKDSDTESKENEKFIENLHEPCRSPSPIYDDPMTLSRDSFTRSPSPADDRFMLIKPDSLESYPSHRSSLRPGSTP